VKTARVPYRYGSECDAARRAVAADPDLPRKLPEHLTGYRDSFVDALGAPPAPWRFSRTPVPCWTWRGELCVVASALHGEALVSVSRPNGRLRGADVERVRADFLRRLPAGTVVQESRRHGVAYLEAPLGTVPANDG